MQITMALHKAARNHPDRTATVAGDRRHSFAELMQRVARLAAAFSERGVGSGARVALLSPNSDKLFEAMLATLWAGGVAVPLNTRWGQRELDAAIDDAEPSLILISEHFDGVDTAGWSCPILRFHSMAEDCPMEGMMRATGPMADTQRSGNDLAFILFTGGTTGRSKGVMLSHGGLMAAAASQSAAGCGTAGGVYLHLAPMFHMADLQMMVNHLLNLSCHVFVPGFDPPTIMAVVAGEGVTDVLLVPTMIQALIIHPAFDPEQLASLQAVFYGAAPMTAALMEQALTALPDCQFIQGYGMTETCLACMLPARYHRLDASPEETAIMRSAGVELPLTEIRIADADGKEVAIGEVGEIQVRSPSVMLGYWRNEEKTAAALRAGWMATEDLAYRDSNGFIYIVDRLKDMIISGGENVYSSEVESVVSTHPAVAQCAVVGIPDEKWGERVHAELVLKTPAQDFSETEFEAFCRARLSAYKCPRSISTVAALPLSPAGKVLKAEIRQSY